MHFFCSRNNEGMRESSSLVFNFTSNLLCSRHLHFGFCFSFHKFLVFINLNIIWSLCDITHIIDHIKVENVVCESSLYLTVYPAQPRNPGFKTQKFSSSKVFLSVQMLSSMLFSLRSGILGDITFTEEIPQG